MVFHIVDAQPVICEFINSVLDRHGHETRIFHSHHEYLDYLESDDYSRPAALFADISMPMMSGNEMVRKVLAAYPDQKFVIISGMPDIENQWRCDNCLFLKKPFDPGQLKDVIAEITLQKSA